MTCLSFGKRLLIVFSIFCGIFVCAACSPTLTIQATGNDGATISFQTGFSAVAERTLKSIVGAVSGASDADASLFSADDITLLMQMAGLQNVTSSAPNATAIATRGTTPAISGGKLSQAGILSRTPTSLTLSLGATQIQTLYALLDENAQAYFDLMMIPALTDETMTPTEYNGLLASVYGQTFADEITNGVFALTLTAPDGKKQTTATLTLGTLLTLTTEKTWTVTW